jgi:hypothetical protein
MKLPVSDTYTREKQSSVSSSKAAAIYGPPSPPSQAPPKRVRLRDDPRLDGLVEPRDGQLGTDRVEQRFDDSPLGTLKAGCIHVLPSVVIIPAATDALVEQTDHGAVLTGHRGSNNECRVIFRHAYVRARVQVRAPAGAADAHIGFLGHRDFEEVHGFSIVQPKGSRGSSGGWLRFTLEYRAGPLCELQGFVWRGGLLEIESVWLSP